MKLEELFKLSQNGTLTYEQAQALMTERKANFVDLSEGGYVDKHKYTDDLASRDTRITELDNTVKTRDSDLADLKGKLDAAGADATKLAELSTSFSDLQAKYDKDTKAYAKQLKEQEYKHAVQDFANQYKFTCQAARRDFVSALMAKNLSVENDVILGATDFVAQYKTANADAFADDASPEQQPKPHFAGPTGESQPASGANNPFNFQFQGVRPHEK